MNEYKFFIESTESKFDNGEITMEQYTTLTQMINERYSGNAMLNSLNSDTFSDYRKDLEHSISEYTKEYEKRMERLRELENRRPRPLREMEDIRAECQKIIEIKKSLKTTLSELKDAWWDFDNETEMGDPYTKFKIKRNPYKGRHTHIVVD